MTCLDKYLSSRYFKRKIVSWKNCKQIFAFKTSFLRFLDSNWKEILYNKILRAFKHHSKHKSSKIMVVNFKNKRAFKDFSLNNIISTLGRHVMLVILKYPFRQDGNLLSTFNKQTKNSIMPIYSITRPKKLVIFCFPQA